MSYQDSISTIQIGYNKLLHYASENEWTPTSSILEWCHGVDFTELDLLMSVTQIVRRGV